MVKRPSDDLKMCAACHKKAAANYGKALHYTSWDSGTGPSQVLQEEVKTFDSKVFEQSCRSCHAPGDPVT